MRRLANLLRSQLVIALVAIEATVPSSSEARRARTHAAPSEDAGHSDWESQPTFSPDGKRIAFVSETNGNLDIWIRDVVSGAETPFTTDPADDVEPHWSPAGDCLAFRSDRQGGGLFVACLDGSLRQIAKFGREPRWSADGAMILFTWVVPAKPPAVYIVNASGGDPRPVQARLTSSLVGPIRARWLTDDRRVAVIGTHPQFGAALWSVPIDGSDAPVAPNAVLTQLLTQIRASHPPRFELSSDGTAMFLPGAIGSKVCVFRVPLDTGTLALSGAPECTEAWDGEGLTIALTGPPMRVAASVETSDTRIWVYPLDPASGHVRLADGVAVGEPGATSVFPELTRDGGRLLYTTIRKNKPPELRILQRGGASVLLSADGCFRFGPRWSPSSTMIAYRWHRTIDSNETAVRMVDLSTRREQAVTAIKPSPEYTPFGWTSDGTGILASVIQGGGATSRTGLVKIPVAGNGTNDRQARVLAIENGFQMWQAQTSPDGRWVAFVLQPLDNAWSSLAVVPAAGGPYRRITTDLQWDDKPRWSSDGRTLYFLSRRSGEFELWRIAIDLATGVAAGPPEQLSSLTTARRHLFRGVGWLDLGFGGDTIAVPVETSHARLTTDAAPSAGTPPARCDDASSGAAIPALSEDLKAPRLLRSERPRYPERALRQSIEGDVQLQAIVELDGSVRPLCVTKSIDGDLDREAVATAKRWRFEPGRLDGRQVPVLITLQIAFTIRK